MIRVLARQALTHRLELAGIDLWQGALMDMNYTAMVPRNPRLEVSEWSEEGDEPGLHWDGFDLHTIELSDAERCLWEFIALEGRPNEDLLEFIQRWGIPYDGWGDTRAIDRPNRDGWESLDTLRPDVAALRDGLSIMVETENGVLVPLESLLRLSYEGSPLIVTTDDEDAEVSVRSEALNQRLMAQLTPDTTTDVRKAAFDELRWRTHEMKQQVWFEHRARERREGRGLDYQRLVVATFVHQWGFDSGWVVTWSGAKRSVRAAALGFHSLIGEHLREIFAAPALDVFQCSMCLRPFPFDSSDGQRRPRRNSKRYCSDACRLEGKRASNRASWQRNGRRWRGGQR